MRRTRHHPNGKFAAPAPRRPSEAEANLERNCMDDSSLTREDKPTERPRLNVRDVARAGKIYSLALDRFPGMPLFPGHPPFQVLTYRSPQGIRVSGAQPWGPGNEARLGYMCEYVLATSHSGAHIEALAHMTIGEDDHWFCGAAATHLGV